MNKKDLARITAMSEVDILIDYHRRNNPGVASHTVTLQYLSDFANSHNNKYVQLIKTLEAYMQREQEVNGTLEGIDIRKMIEITSVADLSLMGGNSLTGDLCIDLVDTYDFLNGAPEQNIETRKHLQKAIEIFEGIENAPTNPFISDLRNFKGNNLEILLTRMKHDNDLYGYNATFSDDPDVRSRETQEHYKISDALNKIEQMVFGHNPMPKYKPVDMKNFKECSEITFRNSRNRANAVHTRLQPAFKMQQMIEDIPYELNTIGNTFIAQRAIDKCKMTLCDLYTYSQIGKDSPNQRLISARIDEVFEKLSELVVEPEKFNDTINLMKRQVSKNLASKIEHSSPAMAAA
ncbi:hypothetical protein [Vibrio harveyi]|uniref:hypothetical protein n=1 Tax=Vibrio harveyi TaxID=669 RepID=UPI003CFA12CE